MFKISDLCPIPFSPQKYVFASDTCYIQRFYTTDKPLIQVLHSDDENITALIRNINGESTLIELTSFKRSDGNIISYFYLTNIQDGTYFIELNTSDGDVVSELFSFTSSDSILEETSLFRYSHDSNNSIFDAVFWDGDVQLFFDFRIEAGFKPSNTSYNVVVEQFRDQYQNIKELYSVPYKKETLTVGNSFGVPIWVADLLNLIFSTRIVYINAKRYVRSESSVPEITSIMEGEQMFNISISLEDISNKRIYNIQVGDFNNDFNNDFNR